MNAEKVLEVLKCDLALNENNNYICSKLGGNDLEFRKLLSLNSIISDTLDNKICISNNTIQFNRQFLESTSLKEIREALSLKLNDYHPNLDNSLDGELKLLAECKGLFDKLLICCKARKQKFDQINNQADNDHYKLSKPYYIKYFNTNKLSKKQFDEFKFMVQDGKIEDYRALEKELITRFVSNINSLLAGEEQEINIIINNFPSYIILSASRSNFGGVTSIIMYYSLRDLMFTNQIDIFPSWNSKVNSTILQF